jgi:hypothetical protein
MKIIEGKKQVLIYILCAYILASSDEVDAFWKAREA